MSLIEPHLEIVHLQAAGAFRHQAFPHDWVYFPHEGLLSLLAITPGGETIEMASAGRNGAIFPIFQPDLRDDFLSPVGSGALHASRIAVAQLDAASSEDESLARALESCRAALLIQLRQNAMCSGLHSVEQRLARWLLETADRLESDNVPATQETVAQRLGVRRTTVTLMASKLQDVDAIRWGRSCVEILDRARLASAACSCYGALLRRVISAPAPHIEDPGRRAVT
jgi:CRP-like cAMP-binding protein